MAALSIDIGTLYEAQAGGAAHGTASGTWACNAQATPVCAGTTGTFTAVQQ
jgi:hypothetical protein